jgi:hypothetical protein
LNPLLLLGLAAAAIPILLHLLTLRKLPTVPFSSLRFLRELQKTKMRRIRLTQWLLLALRTLLIVSLVMAFARPALRGSLLGTIGAHARTTSLVLLDDSPSMGLRNDRGELFARARSVAGEIASLMEEGDELTLLPLSAVRNPTPPPAARTAGAVDRVLGAAAVSPLSPPIREGIGLAARLLGETRNFNREVHLITDLQATQVNRGIDDTSDLFDDRVRVFLHDVGASRFVNAGITGARLRSRILAPGRPAVLDADVQNPGPAPLKNLLLSAYLGSTRVAQQALDIPAGGTVSAAVSVTPGARGFVEGYLQIEDDPLEADNRRYFVLPVPADVRVLLAASSVAAAREPDLALQVQSDTGGSRSFTHETVAEEALSSLDPGRFDVLVFAGLRDFTESEAERIARFVRSGGGLLLFPGDDADAANYASTLFPALGLPAPGGAPPAGGDAVGFGRIDFNHPLFEGLFEAPRTGAAPAVESPRVLRSILPRTGAQGQSIITLTNGVSFLTEYTAGEGRVLLVAVEAGLGWSDFPLRGLFVPLLHRSVMYLASRNQATASAVAGDAVRLTLRLPDRRPEDTYALHAPDSVEEKVAPAVLPGSAFAAVTTPPTRAPGIHVLVKRRGTDTPVPVAAVPVNGEPAETDLRTADDETLRRLWASAGIDPAQVTTVAPSGEVPAAVLQSRFGKELWPHFLVLAALCALAEMVVGRVPKAAGA